MARVVTRWFQEQRDIEVLDWPSKGCDMNPIENVWAHIVNAWEPAAERTRAQLLQHTNTEWEVLRRRPDIVYNTVADMQERFQTVIDAQGGWGKY